jgi:hypothetical protein
MSTISFPLLESRVAIRHASSGLLAAQASTVILGTSVTYREGVLPLDVRHAWIYKG